MADNHEDGPAGAEPASSAAPDIDPALAAALEPAKRLTAAAQRFGRLVDDPDQPGVVGLTGPAGPDTTTGAAVGREAATAAAATGRPPESLATSPSRLSRHDSGPAGRLRADLLVRPHRRAPAPGWRRTVYRASAGLIRMPPTAAELRRLEKISQVRTPVATGHHRVAILSMKGGVGKTTITVGLGSMLALQRGDRIIALDANPDRGTLSDKVPLQSQYSIRDLVAQRARISRYSDMRGFTSQTASRLEVLASEQDPVASADFSEDDYCAACALLERFYSICLTDCGTGLMHSAMSGVLRLADQVVLVTTASVDSARSGSATLDWLAARGHEDLVRDAVVAITAVHRPGRGRVDVDVLEEHFAARCRAVTRVPYDGYLAEGGEADLDQVAGQTADAYLALAALVAERFSCRRGELAAAR